MNLIYESKCTNNSKALVWEERWQPIHALCVKFLKIRVVEGLAQITEQFYMWEFYLSD